MMQQEKGCVASSFSRTSNDSDSIYQLFQLIQFCSFPLAIRLKINVYVKFAQLQPPMNVSWRPPDDYAIPL